MSEMQTDPYQPEGYQPQTYGETAAVKPSGQMDYMRSLSFIFENPNWLQNVGFTALCFFIPLIGQLVLYGYQFEIVETLHLRGGRSYPDFDFNRFVDYLQRGLWVFLVVFIIGIATIPVTMALFFLVTAIVGSFGAAGGEDAVPVGMAIAMPLFVSGIVIFSVLVNMFSVPFVLRAGLTQDFNASFNFGFAKQFVANTWGQMIVAGIFFFISVMVLELIGLAMMCIGIIFTVAAAMLMQAHLLFQLYQVHLAKGGEAIHIQPPKTRL